MPDTNSDYFKLEIDKSEHDKTALTFHNGLYRFSRVPFELITALQLFREPWTWYWRLPVSSLHCLSGGHLRLYKVSPGPHRTDLARFRQLYNAGITLKWRIGSYSRSPLIGLVTLFGLTALKSHKTPQTVLRNSNTPLARRSTAQSRICMTSFHGLNQTLRGLHLRATKGLVRTTSNI